MSAGAEYDGCLCWRASNEKGGMTDNGEEGKVPPRRCLFILSHQFHVNIWLFCGAVHILLPYVFPVVEVRIYDEGGDGSE